jgi:antitoxin PrlF
MITAKLSSKSQTVLPKSVREHLGIGPGDEIDFELVPGGAVIHARKKARPEDPFATFTEWSGDADEKAYAGL